MKKLDLKNKQFGDLLVIDEAKPYVSPKGYVKSQWRCKCVCGNEVIVMSSHLTTGHTISCGCRKTRGLSVRQPKNLVGQKFGMLTVLKRLPNKKVGKIRRAYWLCQCECGNVTKVLGTLLKQGSVKSCGCLNHSHGERLMNEYLTDKHVKYKSQCSFSDLIGLNGGLLKFDYGIYDCDDIVALIELNGEQHYKSVKYFGGTDAFNTRKTHDSYKKKWAKEHNIKLFIINTSKCISEESYFQLYDLILGDFLQQIKI